MASETKCPECGSLVLPSQKVCDCGWVKVSALVRQECDGCLRVNKTLRMHHFLTIGPSQLASHIKQFLPNMDKFMLDGYMGEVSRLHRRYSGRFDENGTPLTAADAWMHYCVERTPSQNEAFEQYHKAHVAKHDLRRRPGEERREFARRCMQAAISPNPGPLSAALNTVLANALREREPGCDDEVPA